ncbi:MAG: M6 family metalloprotease domain-containing protein [Paludibacteraceae bacterium]|nr:M6 family metalloprotease domain-containing protein [Paludibacteraceae bacterium]
MMKKFYLLLMLCASFLLTKAVPAYPGLCSFSQSDGTTISFYLHGDEHFSYKTTEDGYLITEDEDGMMKYASLREDGVIVPYGMSAHNLLERSVMEQNFVASLDKPELSMGKIKAIRQQRIKSAVPGRRNFPLRGSPRALIILVSYSDVAFTTPKQDFEDLANQHDYSANGGTGSIKDYFTESSFGQFSPDFDVYGPYTLSQPRSYYGAHTSTQNDANAHQMIIDACLAADADVNFADYDVDNDGYVDNIFVYFAGTNEAEGGPKESIWPHRSSLSYYDPPTLDGVTLADYACTSELRGYGGMCGIGTFCHEFSHVLGLPDFYDTDYAAGAGAMGDWDIMTQGNYNNAGRTPPTYTAYERFYIGWLTPTALANDTNINCEGSYTLKSLISSNTAYLISATQHNLSGKGPNPKEFFMLEYRKMEGRDTYTGLADGLLITHINYNSSTWSQNAPNNDKTCLGYYPVLQSGRMIASGTSSDLYPYISDNCPLILHGQTEPMLRKPTNIALYDSVCAFDYVSPNEKLRLSVRDIDAFMAPVETQFVVAGSGINEKVSVTFSNTYEFSLRRHTADDSENYSSSITLSPDEEGNLSDTVDIKYNPKYVTYDSYRDNTFSVKGMQSSSLTKLAKFRYRNRRPIYITEPVAYDPKEITANSATLTWSFVADTVEDAHDIQNYGAKYYLDVYSSSDEPEVDTVDFENFPELENGWSANFETFTTAKTGSGARAAELKSSRDTLYSKAYASDIESVTLWFGSISSQGVLYIAGQDYETGEWKTLKQYPVTTTTSKEETYKPKKSGPKYRRLKFYYVPENGSLSLDFIRVQTTTSFSYVVNNEYLRDTIYTVQNLKLGQEYKFIVRATDKDELFDEPRYENITKPSNEVVFVTKNSAPVDEDEDLSIAVVQVEGTNRYVVYISEIKEGNYKLFVFNLNGILVDILPVVQNPVMLPQLPVGQYILRYSKDNDVSKSGPTVKFHYTSNLK